MDNSFNLNDYDCIGFDLDNTLVEYVEIEIARITYHALSSFLVSKFGYSSKHLLRPIEEDINFMRKGLTIDIERGNILSLAGDGTVLRASHGTRPMSYDDIIKVYGINRKWDIAETHCSNMLATWNGALALKIRSSMDYFDICNPLLFARTIDAVDESNENGDRKNVQAYGVWSHIYEALIDMWQKENYQKHKGGYYDMVKENPFKYIRRRSPAVLNWFKSLKKQNKILFLVTGSDVDYGSFVAETGLGSDWRQYFDIVIFYAKKPGFFFQERPFRSTETDDVVDEANVNLGQSFREGNFKRLRQLFARKLSVENPKCLYIGDNFFQDIYSPAETGSCETVAVLKEMEEQKDDPDLDKLMKSSVWGSIIFDDINQRATLWGDILFKYSKWSISSIERLMDAEADN